MSGDYPFPLDRFQRDALAAWATGASLLVAAPTGSGKTVVAEHAIEWALSVGQRAFYTAPIKALSNQKFLDLVRRLGPERVGLLTGDNSINGDADVVVMTTEVLRNMIYARAHGLDRLGVVVLDEVHFLQDAYRGPVWEEVIIHLPASVRLVCLSATVSNAAQVAEWLTTVRGATTAIVEERRPVSLEQLYLVGDRTMDRVHILPTVVDGGVNSDALRLDSEAARGPVRRGRRSPGGRRRLQTPGRVEVVELLAQRQLLPLIYFIFSRAACDDAARSCLNAGLHFTEPHERAQIRAIADERLEALGAHDLDVLGYGQFLAQLEAGIAAHHAGMIPPFKEVVELAFARGLVKVVFATETLAVGVNMPARTVVIEKLTKFTGDHHTMLTPGEFTQLTGRAGRRGMDPVGHAVVLWSPFVTYEQVVHLVTSKSFHLRSAFRPTYNMAANLIRNYTAAQARHLLNLSFAQFQADREVVGVESRLSRREAEYARLRDAARSPFGDIDAYRHLTAEQRTSVAGATAVIDRVLFRLRPGDVIVAAKDKYVGRVAVLTVAARNDGVRVMAVTTRGALIYLRAIDFIEPPRVIGSVDLPGVYLPRAPEYQRQVAEALRRATTARVELSEPVPGSDRSAAAASHTEDAVAAGATGVERDPDLETRLQAAVAADRLGREIAQLRQRMTQRNQSVAADFDRVLGVLQGLGYVDGWALSDAGEMLSRIFHESDLLIAEALRRGLLDGLDAATMAALCSVFVYEHRSPDEPPPAWFPSRLARQRWEQIDALSVALGDIERAAGLGQHRPPDPTFAAVAFAWAAGEGFADVVESEELSGGDFVRTTKQLIDLLRQIAVVAPEAATRRSAQQANDALARGIIEASSALEVEA